MRSWLIKKLLKMLGYKPTKEICISITADASLALDAINKVKEDLAKLTELQKHVNLNMDGKIEKKTTGKT